MSLYNLPELKYVKAELLKPYKIDTNDVSQQKIKVLEPDELYDENSDTDVPLRFVQFIDNSIYVSVAKGCEGLIKDYLIKYSNDLFSDNGCEYLYSVFTDYMHKMQRYNCNPYTYDDEIHKHMVYYTLAEKNNIKYEKIQNNTVMVNNEASYNNITAVYQTLSENGIYFGTLVNNDIVSIVGTNTNLQNKVIDIGLKTHPDFRRKGFALSNIAAISDCLIKMDKIVLYGCNNMNKNSIDTAISSGFHAIAKEKTLWFVGE